MKKYRFKKVLLIIACFSLVLVMAACGSSDSSDSSAAKIPSDSGGSSHAKISTDPDNPSTITFNKYSKDGDIFYQSIYNSKVDDPDAEPGTIYGCYIGTIAEIGDDIKFIVYKPELSPAITQAIADGNLKYFVIREEYKNEGEPVQSDTLCVFKDDASFEVTSRDKQTIKGSNNNGNSLVNEDYYFHEVGSGVGAGFDSSYTTFDALGEEYILDSINEVIEW